MFPYPASFLALALAFSASPHQDRYFKITVVDEETGRGVPLVELRTVNNLRYYTDSNGIAAFFEPGLMEQTVFFHIKSHGYEFAKDGFGFRGKAVAVKKGGSATLAIKRLNIAERLYRVTGGGIYRDSILVGQPAPIRQPALNAKVLGSDSVVNALYHGKLYWFWGDTNRPAYPLGNFHVAGATSALPDKGGLKPEVGVDLHYFVNGHGFAQPMARMPGQGPTWISGLAVLRDRSGRERMFTAYVKVRKFLEVYEHGLAVFDDSKQRFEKLVAFDPKAAVYPGGHPFHHSVDGVEYIYFANPYPLIRVPAGAEHLKRLTDYEAFTCLKPGSRLDKIQLDRDRHNHLVYAWKKNTPPLAPQDEHQFIKAGRMKPAEALLQLRDVETGQPVAAHSGSVYWNRYRKRWVMIAVQVRGKSPLGEVWFAEADSPLGPWVYARKIVTHDRYSFYNPKQHPMFDEDHGRVIFFEGTYANTFSGNPEPTPRYDYNQIMYRLDLSDPRLILPVPVYVLAASDLPMRFGTVQALGPKQTPRIAFFAPDRPRQGTVPVFEVDTKGSGSRLQVGSPASVAGGCKPVPAFYALPLGTKSPGATTVGLYEFVSNDGKSRAYSIDCSWSKPGYHRSKQPLFLVWPNPMRVTLPLQKADDGI